MLKERFVIRTRPMAESGNMIYWGDYRVTVLGDRLFRVERSKERRFRDEATQAIWYRDMPKQEFSAYSDDAKMTVDTGACKLLVFKAGGHVRVELNGTSYALDNYGNLLGTYRTLDGCDGDMFDAFKHITPHRIELGKGVCSKTGVAIINDSDSLTLGADGMVKNQKADGSDEYVFAFGNDYRGALRALYALTGYTPLVPRYALGNWWSRYHVYTEKEYLRVLAAFEERNIPLTVATVDMDWHYSEEVDEQKQITASGKNSMEYVGECCVNLGWTGYSWNRDLFPNPSEFLKKIHQQNLKITLNVHPSDGVRFWEDKYSEMANAMGMDESKQKQVPFDFTYDRFINAYFDVLHKPLEREGVDFWWLDWQQPNIAWHEGDEKNYDPLWALNHYHYLDNAEDSYTPLILSRYAGVGSHRYPIGFSGDTRISWNTLAYLPYFTATASNIGYTWWSHDIGGHNFGDKNDELYLRHVQYGVFSPINRLHCANDETMTKEPWMYGNGTGRIAEEFLRLRHRLIPYLYNVSYQTSAEGRALVEPLYYEWKDELAYSYNTEYLFGSELLVAPVTSKKYPDGYARIRAWLPQGTWTDIFTGDVYTVGEGGKEVILLRNMDSIPVLAKSGGIIPLSADCGNGCDNPKKLEIWTYEGDGKYILYEDGRQRDFDGEARTYFIAENTEKDGVCTQILTIAAQGDGDVIPLDRELLVRFKNIENAQVRLLVNGEEVHTEEWLTDCAAIRFPFAYGKTYRVEARYEKHSALEKAKARAKRVLIIAEGTNEKKDALYKALQKAENIEEYLALIETSGVSEIAKLRLKENL